MLGCRVEGGRRQGAREDSDFQNELDQGTDRGMTPRGRNNGGAPSFIELSLRVVANGIQRHASGANSVGSIHKAGSQCVKFE